MEEKERLKRRKKALQNAGYRSRRMNDAPASAKDLFCFRIYVTVIIVGLTIALSFMPSTSAKALTGNLKQAIAHKVSMEGMQDGVQEVWQKTRAMSKGLQSQTKEQIGETKSGDANIEQEVKKGEMKDLDTEGIVPASNEFIPDLPDDP